MPNKRSFRVRSASCPKCQAVVLAATDTCPWCDTAVIPDATIATTMDRALEGTTLFHLTTRAEIPA